MKKLTTNIPFDYVAIKTTKSRIDKGLLAIPVSLVDLFPKNTSKIYLIDETGSEEARSFTPYNSSSRECRIGGLKKFYDKYNIKNGDELVIQLLDDGKFKIIPERIFEKQVSDLETEIEESKDEKEIDQLLDKLSEITNKTPTEVIQSEFIRLSNQTYTQRKTRAIEKTTVSENIPASIRKILLYLYKGKCQISDFTFLIKTGNPYFEVHHINTSIGHHLKNLLVVCPNIHAQFTYANTEQFFDSDGWLRMVKFNNDEYKVKQIVDTLPKSFQKELHLSNDA